jgi:3-phenylpropionate/trans-cinnamate dioxygenase ferredoxin subunit
MTAVRVCALSELADSTPRLVHVDGQPVCLVRVDREVHAVDDVCTHGAVSLSEGDIDGNTVECWLHGSVFDLRTGKPLSLPATEPIAVYPVTIEADNVLVTIKESESA